MFCLVCMTAKHLHYTEHVYKSIISHSPISPLSPKLRTPRSPIPPLLPPLGWLEGLVSIYRVENQRMPTVFRSAFLWGQ